MNLYLHEIVYIIILFCAAALFLLAWPRRKNPGGGFFVCHLIALVIWDIGLLCEAESVVRETKILWSQISYLGVVTVAPLLFLFILAYTSQEKVSLRSSISLMVVPAVVLIAAWTNEWHHLLWPWFLPGSSHYNTLVYGHGIIFYVNVIYIYFLIAFGVAILIRAIPRNQPPFRSQLIVILVAVFFPMVSGIMYIFNFDPVPGMDISIFGFLVTNLVLAFGFVHYRLLDLVPVANDVVVNNLQDGMIVIDWMKRIVKINQNAEELLGLPAGNLLGKKLDEVFPESVKIAQKVELNKPVEFTIDQPRKRYLDLRVSNLTADAVNSPGTLLILRDISRQKEAEIKLNKANDDLKIQLKKINNLQVKMKDQALHDSLTGLFNYRAMDETLDGLLAECVHLNRPFSLVIIDIDHFKRVNDVYGHQTGNTLLQEYGRALLSSVRKNDFIYRFGGDEILLAFQEMTGPEATRKAEEIRQMIKKIHIEQNLSRVSTTVSIGVASYPENGSTIQELVSAADQALYEGKEKGRDRVVEAEPPNQFAAIPQKQ
jgi:diguanylate cyclase (GGDEF)-like protein/PAS domain S-box-containing protein